MLSATKYERVRRPVTTVAWLYFIFMAYMLLSPRPPVDFIPVPVFSVVHFLAFLTLGVLTGLARRRGSFFFWCVLLVGWSGGSECLQRYTGRYFELFDIYQNVSGSILGFVVATVARRRLVERAPASGVKRAGAVAILFHPEDMDEIASGNVATRRVLAIRRSQNVAAPGTLCFPGGGVEEGETPAKAAVREFREEVGLEIRVGDVVAENRTPSGAPLFWFAAEFAAPSRELPEITLQRDEVAGYEWRTLQELLDDPDFLTNNRDIVEKMIDGRLELKFPT